MSDPETVDDHEKPERLDILFAMFGIVVGLVVLYAAFILYMVWPIDSFAVDRAGVFGDSFGILTSVFSGLGFAVIFFTLHLQRKELGLQRKELSLTRQVMSDQHDTIRVQSFEATFFQILRLHNEIVGSMDMKSGRSEYKGRDCFDGFLGFLKVDLGWLRKEYSDVSIEELLTCYENMYEEYHNDLGIYFRNLYRIMKFLDDQNSIDGSYIDSRLYAKIVRAQLSDPELAILYFNGISTRGEKFKKIIEKYALLDNLPDTYIINMSVKELYAPSAFGIQSTSEG